MNSDKLEVLFLFSIIFDRAADIEAGMLISKHRDLLSIIIWDVASIN